MKRVPAWMVVACTCYALACAGMGCAAFVDKADYADYRDVRLAQNDAERLLAIQHYVTAHPEGHWHAELTAEQITREVEVYETGKATREGLELYVQAYPQGRFVDQARARLLVVSQIEQRKAQERAEAERVAIERRARDEELRRTWVTRFASYWTDTLLAVRQWGEPIADIARLNPEFSRAFGKSPRPQCNATECVKHYRASYGVPVPGGTRLERSIELDLRLLLRDGRVTRVELLFPRRGFSRWFELENRRPVIDEDPQMRAEAIAWALDKVKPWLAKLGEQRAEVADLVFEPVLSPSLGPSGEVTDTTATDPSSQVQGINAENAPETAPENDLVIDVPQGDTADEPAPDMVIGPIVIPGQGHSVQTTEPQAAPPPVDPNAGEIMTLGAIDVGAGDGTEAAVPESNGEITAPSVSPPVQMPAQTYAVVSGDLRVVVFAETPGGWDGIRIEHIVAPRSPQAPTRPTSRPR